MFLSVRVGPPSIHRFSKCLSRHPVTRTVDYHCTHQSFEDQEERPLVTSSDIVEKLGYHRDKKDNDIMELSEPGLDMRIHISKCCGDSPLRADGNGFHHWTIDQGRMDHCPTERFAFSKCVERCLGQRFLVSSKVRSCMIVFDSWRIPRSSSNKDWFKRDRRMLLRVVTVRILSPKSRSRLEIKYW